MPTYALVLIAAPGSVALDAGALRTAGAALGDRRIVDAGWLAPSEACELVFEAPANEPAAPVRATLAAAFAGAPVDVNIVPADPASRRKRLLVADMDSTIIEQECIDEIAAVRGLKARIAAITERAMRGELDFESALTQRLALLAGVTEAELQRVYDTAITLMPGATTLVATMQANGATCALVSGGFTFFTSRIAARVGFDAHHANTLGVADGCLTGKVVGPILGKEAKFAQLEHYTQALGLLPSATLAVGDGANDLAMIGAAGLGVAYRAKPIVAAGADAAVTHGDLTALLYLQGYARAEFVGS